MTPQIRREVVYKHVVQDIIIPIDEMSRSIDLFHEWFEIYPLLIFPIAVFDHGKYEGFMRNPKNKIPGKKYEVRSRGRRWHDVSQGSGLGFVRGLAVEGVLREARPCGPLHMCMPLSDPMTRRRRDHAPDVLRPRRVRCAREGAAEEAVERQEVHPRDGEVHQGGRRVPGEGMAVVDAAPLDQP